MVIAEAVVVRDACAQLAELVFAVAISIALLGSAH